MSISANNSRRVVAAGLALMLAGCTVGPDFKAPDRPAAGRYTPGEDPRVTVEAGGVAQSFATGAELPGDWWRLFASPILDDAIRTGLAGSPTLEAAQASLRQAEANLAAGAGIFYPQVGVSGDAMRQRPAPAANPVHLHEGIYNIFTLSTSVSYALDLFGGNARSVEALGALEEAQRNAARAAALTLVANIATTLIADAGYRAEIAATEAIIGRQRDQVRLAQVQADAGTGPYAAVLTLRTQLETTEATLPPLRQKRVQARDLLAVLRGRLPSDGPSPEIALDDLTLPHDLPVSLPSALVGQRPDILQAEATLHAASAQIGVATAALLPSVTLNGALGVSDTAGGGLFSAQSKLWSVGAGVTQPVFNGGTLWAQRQAAIDAFDAANATYRQTVLAAFGQVADTLRALDHDAEGLAIADRALATAGRALALVQANYTAGLATYSDVLSADRQYQQARISEIQARAARLQDSVALFAALGGGWWNEGK